MSELIDNAKMRKDILKQLIKRLHQGQAPADIRPQLEKMLGRVPYSEVVEVEQQLMAEGMAAEEILSLCDMHSQAMRDALKTESKKEVPAGHPVDTFRRENEALIGEVTLTEKLLQQISALSDNEDATDTMGQIRLRFSRLIDVDKHYSRKENLLFPYLEKHGIDGPPKVMWGKDDEVRALIKGAAESLQAVEPVSAEEARSLAELVITPALDAIKEMVFKEENILLPMSIDTLSEQEFYSIYRQSADIGFCIYDPTDEWQPKDHDASEDGTESQADGSSVRFGTGSLSQIEMEKILNTIPFDLTFVGADDRVKYFTQGRERIFERNRAILGREVQMCHPPKSVHIVQKIVEDFRSGRQDSAPFWINLGGRFIHIEYYAIRDDNGTFLGTLEVSQDLTKKRALEGEQRLLSYDAKDGSFEV